MTDERKAFIADLEMVIERIEDLRDKAREDAKGDLTPRQEGRAEGVFATTTEALSVELRPMLQAWKAGYPFSLKGEQIMELQS